MVALGVDPAAVIDRDRFSLSDDMPDPLMADGKPNPEYGARYMSVAREMGRAVWEVFGPRISPDFVVERPDQSTLHYSSFLLRDFDEHDAMPNGIIVVKGGRDLSILGSHMYHDTQAREVVRLLAAQHDRDGTAGPGNRAARRAGRGPAEDAGRAARQAQGRRPGPGRHSGRSIGSYADAYLRGDAALGRPRKGATSTSTWLPTASGSSPSSASTP